MRCHRVYGWVNQEVSIINRRRNSGMLKLRGVVRCCNGDMQRPSRGMLLDILVEGRECSEHVCLRAENNWCVILDQLPQGRYRIVQKDNLGYRVSYVIDGNEESFGNVELGQCDVEVLIVNQESDCTGKCPRYQVYRGCAWGAVHAVSAG
ncbi:MAG: hypothetical protein ACLRRB_01685 [Ruminococcus sp.]